MAPRRRTRLRWRWDSTRGDWRLRDARAAFHERTGLDWAGARVQGLLDDVRWGLEAQHAHQAGATDAWGELVEHEPFIIVTDEGVLYPPRRRGRRGLIPKLLDALAALVAELGPADAALAAMLYRPFRRSVAGQEAFPADLYSGDRKAVLRRLERRLAQVAMSWRRRRKQWRLVRWSEFAFPELWRR